MKPETATVFYRTRVAGFDVPDVPNVDDYEAVCDVVMPAIDTDAIWAFLQGEDPRGATRALGCRSMSAGDLIVSDDGEVWICDRAGFRVFRGGARMCEFMGTDVPKAYRIEGGL